MKLTALHISILKSLAQYRYLTCSQMNLLELGSISAIRRAVRTLGTFSRPLPILQVLRFPPSVRLGKLEFVYSITPYGLIFLHENVPDFHTSRTLAPVWMLFEKDYHHRKATISFRIRLEQGLRSHYRRSFEIESYVNYYEKTAEVHEEANASHSATRAIFKNGKPFYPDSIFVLSDFHHRGLFIVEIVMGRNKKVILRQIRTHCRAMKEGILSTQYGLEGHDYRALFVFKSERVMQSIVEELLNLSRFTAFQQHFLFATIADTERDVLGCWRMVGDDGHLRNFITGKIAYNIP